MCVHSKRSIMMQLILLILQRSVRELSQDPGTQIKHSEYLTEKLTLEEAQKFLYQRHTMYI